MGFLTEKTIELPSLKAVSVEDLAKPSLPRSLDIEVVDAEPTNHDIAQWGSGTLAAWLLLAAIRNESGLSFTVVERQLEAALIKLGIPVAATEFQLNRLMKAGLLQWKRYVAPESEYCQCKTCSCCGKLLRGEWLEGEVGQ
jgi:hypothetical protein